MTSLAGATCPTFISCITIMPTRIIEFSSLPVLKVPLPKHPTHHPPGSPGKLLVMMHRYAAGVSLWHPRDADQPAPEALLRLLERDRTAR